MGIDRGLLARKVTGVHECSVVPRGLLSHGFHVDERCVGRKVAD